MKIHGQSERDSGLRTPRLNLGDGNLHLGAWSCFRDPLVIDILAAESFDWICIDAQHGGPEASEIQALVEAAHLFSVPTMVRVPGHETGIAGRAIDAGAGAIVFPTVEDAETARRLIAGCRFPPRGKRSYSPTRRSPRYPKPIPGNPEDDPLCILMIETAQGLENLDDILATRPDAILVGPYDLALGLGVSLTELTRGEPDGTLAKIAHRCNEAGVVPGIYAGEVTLAGRMAAIGYRFMPIAADIGLLGIAAHDSVEAARKLFGGN